MNEFSVTPFLEMVYEDTVAMTAEPLQMTENWQEYKKIQKARILDMLKIPGLKEKYEIEMHAVLQKSFTVEGVVIEQYKVDGIKNLSLAVYVFLPVEAPSSEAQKERLGKKAVLFLNGHDDRGAQGTYDPSPNGGQSLCLELAKRGHRVLVPELFAFGKAKRQDAQTELGACASCAETEPWLLNSGLNLLGLRVWETMRCMDFAAAVFGTQQFCAYGISGGGHICNYAGVLDDRITAMIVSGYPNLYRHSTLATVHCICNYVPGQMELGESYYCTALAAPDKKLLVMNGKDDPVFPRQGSEIVFPYLRQVYDALKAGENYTSILFDGGHEIAVEDVCDWVQENWR